MALKPLKTEQNVLETISAERTETPGAGGSQEPTGSPLNSLKGYVLEAEVSLGSGHWTWVVSAYPLCRSE